MTGDVIHEVDHPDTMNISKERMRRLCLEGLDVEYSNTFSHAEFGIGGKGVRVFLEEGGRVDGDSVIGANERTQLFVSFYLVEWRKNMLMI